MTFLSVANRVISVAMVVTVISGCSGKEERIASHMKKGEEYLAETDTDKALVETKNILQMDPKNAQGYFLGGRIHEAREDLGAAYNSYAKALELNPHLYDAKAAMARIQLIAGSPTLAQSTVNEVLAADPSNVEAKIVNAALLARTGDTAGAIRTVRGIKSTTGIPASASILLAGLYSHEKKYEEGLAVVNTALQSEPKNVDLLYTAAQLSQSLGQADSTIGFYERATKAAPKKYAIWRAYAAYFDSQKRYADDERVLRDATIADPEDAQRFIALAEYIGRRRGADAAIKEMVAMSEEHPRTYQINFALASLYHASGDFANARRVTQNVIDSSDSGAAGLTARNTLVVYDIEEGNEQKARAELDDILKINPRDAAALTQRGKLELSHGQLDAAIADLRSAAKDQPDSAPVLSLLADAYDASKQPQQASDLIADSVKLYPNSPELGILQIQYLSRIGQTHEAITAAAEIMRADPKNIRAYEMRAVLQERDHDFAGAEATLHSLANAFPNNAIGAMRLGQFYVRQRKFDAALEQFDRATALDPATYDPRASALGVLVAQHRVAEAKHRVETAIASNPEIAMNYQLLGHVDVVAGDPTNAKSAYQRAIALSPSAIPSYLALASVYASENESDAVLATLNQGLKAVPFNETLLEKKAQYLMQIKQYDQAIAVYTGMIERDPTSTTAANNLGYLLTEIKGDKASMERALALTERFRFTGNADLLDTIGWTHFKLGQNGDALPLLQRAETISPTSPLFHFHYGMALLKSGDANDARDHLKAAAKANLPLPDEARKVVDQG